MPRHSTSQISEHRCNHKRLQCLCTVLEPRRLFSTYVMNGTSGADTWYIEADAGSLFMSGQTTPIPGMTDIQVNGFDGDDLLVVGHTTIPIVFNGGNNNDEISLTSGFLSSQIKSTVTFNGGPGTDFGEARDEASAVSTTYQFSGSQLAWGSGALAWDSSLESVLVNTAAGSEATYISTIFTPLNITINGNSGSDYAFVDMNGSTGQVTFNGGSGAGSDTLDVSDYNVIGPVTYTVNASVVSRAGRTINYSGAESVQLQGVGNSSGTFLVSGANPAMSMTLLGGLASDSFTLTAPQYANMTIAAGGGALNTLVLDDRTQTASVFRATVDTATLSRDYGPDPLNFQTFGLSYSDIQAWTYYAKSTTNNIYVYGISSSIPAGQQATILSGSNPDTITLYPHDANGNLTINGNLGLSGGNGADKVIIDDTASSSPINYTFSNPFGAGTQNVFGMGTRGFGAASDVESFDIRAGGGDDNFALNTWQSGAALIVNGGAGYDTFEISPTAHNLPAAITSMSFFSYDGGPVEDGDHFNIHNYDNTTAWTITRSTGAVAYNGATGYFINFNVSHVGYLFASGGTQIDNFLIRSTPADDMNNDMYGGDGNDVYTIGFGGLTNGIRSYVDISGGAGTNQVIVDDSADTVGRSFHMDQYFINSVPSDTLFPAAGGDIYGILSISGFTGTVTVKLGSGADTIYAAPSPYSTFNIQANNPTTAPGDRLTLALAAATNPVFTPGVTGAGSYSFANRAPLSYSGIETKSIDDVAPAVLATQYNFNPPTGSLPTLDLQFNEDVSPGLYNTHFDVYNSTTGQTFGYGTWSYTFDPATSTLSYSFPGAPGGVLPSGNYTAYIQRVTDVAGNPMSPGGFQFSFSVLAADANGDLKVDLTDFTVLAANFNQTDRTFSEGNFNYDPEGKVDLTDFTILAANFNQTLAASSAPARAAPPASSVGLTRFSDHAIDEQLADGVLE